MLASAYNIISIASILLFNYCEIFLVKIKIKIKFPFKMLNVRNLFVIIIRKYGGQSLFSKEMLCTDANKLKCIQKMQATAPHTTIKQKSNSFAAVLIPIVQSGNGELSLLYTLRSSNLRKHIRQVSFPGK